MKTKAIIFDLNGVLILDSGPLSVRLKKDYGIPVETSVPIITSILKKVRLMGKENELVWQPLLDLTKMNYQELFDYWFRNERLNDEMIDLVRSLKNSGVKVIILSNNFPEKTTFYRKMYPQLFELFDHQYFSWETGNVKPSVQSYSQILNDFKYKPDDFIYFDDKQENLDAASSLGIRSERYEDLESTKKILSSL